MSALQILFRHRRILWATTLHDIRGRYAGTAIGLAWAVLYPLLLLSLYAIVYTMIFKIRLATFTTFDYVLMIFAGLIPFLGFSEGLGLGVGSVVANKTLIKNTLFPIELIPVKGVLVGSLTMLIGLLLLQGTLWMRGTVHLSQILIPLVFIIQILFTIGFIWLLSSLNVFFQDLNQMIPVILLFLMLVSPIAYTSDMIPKKLMLLMYPNPLYYLIMIYRDCMIVGRIPFDLLLIFLMISSGIFYLGYYVFSHLKGVFADYV